MNVTDEMLQAAIKKAIEAGLLPRRACREDVETNKELIRLVVQAALSDTNPRDYLSTSKASPISKKLPPAM